MLLNVLNDQLKVSIPENVEEIQNMVLADRSVKVREIVDAVGLLFFKKNKTLFHTKSQRIINLLSS